MICNSTNKIGLCVANTTDQDFGYFSGGYKTNIIFASLYTPLFFFIIPGNLLLISSVILFHNLRNITNTLYMSLAVSDLIIGTVVLPQQVAFLIWPKTLRCSRISCLLFIGSKILGRNSAMFNLLIITVDRFLLIQFPFSYPSIRGKRNLVLVLASMWGSIGTLALLPLIGINQWDEVRSLFFFYHDQEKAYIVSFYNS